MPVVARKVSDGKKRVLSVKKNGETLLPPRTSSHPPPSPSSSSSSSSSSSCFDALPDHLKEEIFVRVCGKNEVAKLQMTSKPFYKVINSSERLWRTLCEQEVGKESAIVFRDYGLGGRENRYSFHRYLFLVAREMMTASKESSLKHFLGKSHHSRILTLKFLSVRTRDRTDSDDEEDASNKKELFWKEKYRMWCVGETGIMSWGARSKCETTLSGEPNWFPQAPDADESVSMRGGRENDDEENNKFCPRYLHRATQCGTDLTKVILFGGQSRREQFHNDVHFLDLDEKKNPTHALQRLHVKTNLASGEQPLPRCSGSIQTLRVFGKSGLGREVIALFGGSQGYLTGFCNDIAVLQSDVPNEDISTALDKTNGALTWYEPTLVVNGVHGRPAPRWGHTTFAWNGKLLVFGGSNTNTCYNDFWECTLKSTDEGNGVCPFAITATWKLLYPMTRRAFVKIPCPRAGATLCVVKDVAYLFGGCRVSTTFNDLWKFDLSETGNMMWEQVTTTGFMPSSRVGHSMVTIGNRLIVQGGRGMQPNSPLPGKKSTRGLAALQGLIFYESGFSVLDLSKMNWLPKQYPKLARGEESERFKEEEEEEEEEGKDGTFTITKQSSDNVNVREHRTGHAMMLAPQGIALIGGLGYNARFQSDVQLVKLF